MKSDEPTHADAEALHPLHPLVRTLPAALVAHLFFVFLCLLSSLLFIYQFWFEPDYRAWYDVGEDAYPVDDPLAKAHVLGHLVRAVIGAILAWTSFRYLSSIRAIRRNANDAQQKFFAAIRTWWTSFATSAALGIAFGVWVMFGSFAAQHEIGRASCRERV